MTNMYERIGEEKIKQIITEFYNRVFDDVIIGYFFVNKDKAKLIERQTKFVIAMLGGPKKYDGAPLAMAHEEFAIRHAHFDRRQKILEEVMQDLGLSNVEINEWLVLEQNFRKIIVNVLDACSKHKETDTTSEDASVSVTK